MSDMLHPQPVYSYIEGLFYISDCVRLIPWTSTHTLYIFNVLPLLLLILFSYLDTEYGQYRVYSRSRFNTLYVTTITRKFLSTLKPTDMIATHA